MFSTDFSCHALPPPPFPEPLGCACRVLFLLWFVSVLLCRSRCVCPVLLSWACPPLSSLSAPLSLLPPLSLGSLLSLSFWVGSWSSHLGVEAPAELAASVGDPLDTLAYQTSVGQWHQQKKRSGYKLERLLDVTLEPGRCEAVLKLTVATSHDMRKQKQLDHTRKRPSSKTQVY